MSSLRAWAPCESGWRLGVIDTAGEPMLIDSYWIHAWWSHDPAWSALVWVGDRLVEISSDQYAAPGEKRTDDKPRAAWVIPPGGVVPRPGLRPEPKP